MIKLENYEVVGWEHAIRGMRNPMNSWEKSDTDWIDDEAHDRVDYIDEDYEDTTEGWMHRIKVIGPNDYSLMKKLRNAGTDHRKFMRMITVYVDITAPLYWWKEFDTYKVGTVANSCSTMHKIADKRFEMSDFSYEHLLPMSAHYLDMTIEALNKCRDLYLGFDGFKHEFGEADKKEYWWQMIQLLPSSYNQKRTIMLNYEVLANMYKSRKTHKLDEWREFCTWIEQLPYAELIVGEPKTEVAYLCDGEQCSSCDNIDCNHTLDIKHAVNFEKVGDHKYMEVERSPLAHPETYVSDAIAMIGDMTMAQRVEVMKYLNVKVPNKCPYWNYENQTSSHTCNGCEDHGVLVNGDRYCTMMGDDE